MCTKTSFNNGIKEAGTEGEGVSPGRCPVGKQYEPSRYPATAIRKWSKGDNKMAILCYLQAKEGPSFGYRKKMHQYPRNLDCLS